MPSTRTSLLACSVLTCLAIPTIAQMKTELYNYQGATAPCIGIGPVGGPAAKKCAELFEHEGFLKESDVGISGLTLGTSDKDDGIVTKIDDGSPAAQAGLAVGDAIVAIEGKPVRPTPGAIAAQLIFGKRGEEVHLNFRHAGAESDITLVRAPQTAPPGPKSPMLMIVKPLIDWKGEFVPCVGAGPLAPAALSFCEGHFKPFGWIKVGELGTTGLTLDEDQPDRAVIKSVGPDSPAAKANIQPGDEILSVDSKPLAASLGQAATQRLFGKAGDQFHLTVKTGDKERPVLLTLAAKPAKKE